MGPALMLVVRRPSDLVDQIGQELGPTEWVELTQSHINDFADATGDRQWIHVDADRATRDMPGGRTIAHGYLTLAMLGSLQTAIYRVERRSRAINYGLERVRFLSPVPSGSRVRLVMMIASVDPIEGGVRLTSECSLEIEGGSRPALVATTILLIYS